MFKELFKQLPWGMFLGVIVLNLVILAVVVAGATWIIKAIW